MKIAILGSGMVGRGLAGRLAELGHEVVMGTRDVSDTVTRAPFAEWAAQHSDIRLTTLVEASTGSELVLNAINGSNALDALREVGAEALAGRILLDLAIPLDLSRGLPPTLTVANDDSLGEQIQRAFPDTRVVKSLNSVYFEVMIDPTRVPGHHTIFVAGNDSDAKQTVAALLQEFGWPAESILDLGDITGARGTEMYARLYFTLHDALGTFDFNIAVVRAN